MQFICCVTRGSATRLFDHRSATQPKRQQAFTKLLSFFGSHKKIGHPMFRRCHPESQVSLEEGTPAVPRDGCFYVLRAGEVVGRYRTLKKATVAYDKEVHNEGIPRNSPPPPTKEEVDTRVIGDFYIYGKSKIKKSTGTRTFG